MCCVLEKRHNSFYDIWRSAYFAYSTPRRNEAIPSSFVTLSRCNNFLNAMICFTGSCNNDKDTAGELKMLPSVTHNVSKVTELSKCLCHCLCLCLCHCLCLCICLCHFFGHVMSSHHSDQMSQRSQVSWVAL